MLQTKVVTVRLDFLAIPHFEVCLMDSFVADFAKSSAQILLVVAAVLDCLAVDFAVQPVVQLAAPVAAQFAVDQTYIYHRESA